MPLGHSTRVGMPHGGIPTRSSPHIRPPLCFWTGEEPMNFLTEMTIRPKERREEEEIHLFDADAQGGEDPLRSNGLRDRPDRRTRLPEVQGAQFVAF